MVCNLHMFCLCRFVDSPRRLEQAPHGHHGKRYRSHPSDFAREEDLRIGCLTAGTVDVLESDI